MDSEPRAGSLRKRKTKNPCPGCGLHLDLCICNLMPRLNLKTKICLVIHRKELKRTTNTGMLAVKSLVNSDVRIRGQQDRQPLDLSDLLSAKYRSFLFFPADDAHELSAEFLRQPIAMQGHPDFPQGAQPPVQLIVPDGNWRQASKVRGRHPELAHLPVVKISAPNLAQQHLRAEHTMEGMSTLQAIAFALGIIEGPAVMESLLRLYDAKLQNTLRGRGIKEG